MRRERIFRKFDVFRVKIEKIAVLGALFAVVAFLWSFGRDWYWHTHPDSAFRAITQRDLPTGVRVTAYGHQMNDSLFHTTHYWLFAGSALALRQVINGTGFVASEDARYMMPDFKSMFGDSVISTQVVAGYEWEADRDRWYCIFAGETTACYAH